MVLCAQCTNVSQSCFHAIGFKFVLRGTGSHSGFHAHCAQTLGKAISVPLHIGFSFHSLLGVATILKMMVQESYKASALWLSVLSFRCICYHYVVA